MDRPENEQGNRAGSIASSIDGESRRIVEEVERESEKEVSDGQSSWVHGHRIAHSQALMHTLTSLKGGLEKMIETEKAKIEQYAQAKKRMGG